ncbi:lysozyme [Paraburkholderia caribensis]|uniref:lysozyme n=1 Tax=Paraburkholderia caribensis TaxID=75105 RepID=UPI0029C9FB22|nr:lysozyme [Paraburkholderia caribensis]
MALSDLIAIALRAFGMTSKPAVPPDSPPSAGAASTGTDQTLDVPASVPVTDSSAWLPLCRPLVQHFESCVLTAYWDADGKVWTCGWGSTGADVKQGTVWTQEQADTRLDAQLGDAASIVDRAFTAPMSAQQKAALVSIVYNVGPGRAARGSDPGRDGIVVLANGKPSTLLRMFNAQSYSGAADQFLAWNKSGGKVLGGLVKRRAAERSLFLTGRWQA